MSKTAARLLLCALALAPASVWAQPASPPDPIRTLVGRLDLEKYKATIKTLTTFGDRREGTDRNRAAVDWIEAQLKLYGCSNTERLKYTHDETPAAPAAAPAAPPAPRPTNGAPVLGAGGSRNRGTGKPIPPNLDLNAQPDPRIRALDTQTPVSGAREEVWCTKIGATHPEEMYIVSGHMDGRGFGEAANDDGSGTALVMELARIFSGPDVQTGRSIRFILWNNEETGGGAAAYVAQRQALQGKEEPAGSGKYPEPKWLGMIQHDMMMFDHGMPRADGTIAKDQRPEADVNIEFRAGSKMAAQSMDLAWALESANESYANNYPATIGSHMTNTDSGSFEDVVASVSLRELERGAQIGNGWDPQWHQPTDLYTTYNDKDFLLGLNAAETTLSGVARLAGVTLK